MTGLFITGARGQVGSDVLALAVRSGQRATGLGSAELNITDREAVTDALAEFAASGGGTVINCAAYTAVDAAESDPDGAHAVNVVGAENLAVAAAAFDLGFIHISTDYVFDGDGIIDPGSAQRSARPYETDDPTGPRNVYGASKLVGELAVRRAHPGAQVVRTAWVYGAAGKSFVHTMAALEASRPTVSVVDDQFGSPTWSADLAAGLVALAGRNAPGGTLQATGGGTATWFDFARAVFVELGADPDRVLRTDSSSFVRPARRPAYSVLSNRSWQLAGLDLLPDWRSALSTAFVECGTSFRP